MNIYMQNTVVGICEIDDEIIPYPPANAAVSSTHRPKSWFSHESGLDASLLGLLF